VTTRWMKTWLLVSLALNCMVAGGLTYRYIAGGETGGIATEVPGEAQAPVVLPRQIYEERQGIGRKIRTLNMAAEKKQDRLIELLAQDPVDRKKINETIAEINRIQSDLQQMAVERLIREAGSLRPEQKKLYLENFMMYKNRCGMGRRPGGRSGAGRRDEGMFGPDCYRRQGTGGRQNRAADMLRDEYNRNGAGRRGQGRRGRNGP